MDGDGKGANGHDKAKPEPPPVIYPKCACGVELTYESFETCSYFNYETRLMTIIGFCKACRLPVPFLVMPMPANVPGGPKIQKPFSCSE